MKRILFAAFALVLVAGAGVAGYLYLAGASGVPTLQSAGRYSAPKVQFGAVTEYSLANPARWPNGVLVAQDGSVWFGEQALPGVAHLLANGTVVEYKWPGAGDKITGYQTGIWGLMQWEGKIWGTDLEGNRLVGLDPADGTMTVVNASATPYPYLPALAPDGSMWFTALSTPARLGSVGPDMKLTSFKLDGLGTQEPIQIAFVNSTLAYLVALDPLTGKGGGGLYTFDPQSSNGTIVASKAGGDFTLHYPDGLSLSSGAVWVAQHGPSNVLMFDTNTGVWTVFPTSTVSYQPSTFPYFVQTSGGRVWFNEHYANRIALLDPQGYLTEYSESDPPIDNGSQVQQDLTIAASGDGLWFTSTSGNYIGFVDGRAQPGFSITARPLGLPTMPSRMTLQPGGSGVLNVTVSGTWSKALSIQVSDSETSTAVPKLIALAPSITQLAASSGSASVASFSVEVSAQQLVEPGNYTVAVTVTDGLVYQTAYVFVTVL